MYLHRREIRTSCRNWVDTKCGGSRLRKWNWRGRRHKKPQTENYADKAPWASHHRCGGAPDLRLCAVRPLAVVRGSCQVGCSRGDPCPPCWCVAAKSGGEVRWGVNEAQVCPKPAPWTGHCRGWWYLFKILTDILNSTLNSRIIPNAWHHLSIFKQ